MKVKKLELDETKERVRRINNKELPELLLLNKKRKKEEKEDEKEEKEEEEENESIDPTILKVTSTEETKIKWKDILSEFQKENPNLKVVYGRFKINEGHFAILIKPDEELKFKDSLKINDEVFKVEKCEGEDLIEFWKNHGSHYEQCVKSHDKKGKRKIKKIKKGKKEKKIKHF